MANRPVFAAIPNYNMAGELERLLPELVNHGYSEVFVLDDASSDNSRDIAENINGVQFVQASENRGAGATRNGIIPYLAKGALVHFIDADIKPESDRMAERITDMIPSQVFGFVGTLALAKDGIQNVWNYGPRQSLRADAGALLQQRFGGLLRTNPEKAARLRERYDGLLASWPNPLEQPVRKQTFWCIEQSLVVDGDTFADFGGFRPDLREHEIQDLAIRMDKRGLARYFDPGIAVRHTEAEVRNYNRALAQLRAEVSIQREHGVRQWLRG